jgi:hypothetical protein
MEEGMKVLFRAVASLAVISAVFMFSKVIEAKPFYKGKRVVMLINYAPGGGADRSGRVINQHHYPFALIKRLSLNNLAEHKHC